MTVDAATPSLHASRRKSANIINPRARASSSDQKNAAAGMDGPICDTPANTKAQSGAVVPNTGSPVL